MISAGVFKMGPGDPQKAIGGKISGEKMLLKIKQILLFCNENM